MTYHGPLYKEERDKPRLDSVKAEVADALMWLDGEWCTVPILHDFMLSRRPCFPDTVRRMLNYLMKEGTDTHTFHSRGSKTNPGTAEYSAKLREKNDD